MTDEAMMRRMRERTDAQFMSALGVTSTVAAEPPEPLTIDTIRAMMDKMPPRQTWLSSKLFPSENAMFLRTQREHWAVAHPDFWTRFTVRWVASGGRLTHPWGSGWDAIEIIDIDAKEGDDDRTKARKDRERKRYADALAWSIRAEEIMRDITIRPSMGAMAHADLGA